MQSLIAVLSNQRNTALDALANAQSQLVDANTQINSSSQSHQYERARADAWARACLNLLSPDDYDRVSKRVDEIMSEPGRGAD